MQCDGRKLFLHARRLLLHRRWGFAQIIGNRAAHATVGKSNHLIALPLAGFYGVVSCVANGYNGNILTVAHPAAGSDSSPLQSQESQQRMARKDPDATQF